MTMLLKSSRCTSRVLNRNCWQLDRAVGSEGQVPHFIDCLIPFFVHTLYFTSFSDHIPRRRDRYGVIGGSDLLGSKFGQNMPCCLVLETHSFDDDVYEIRCISVLLVMLVTLAQNCNFMPQYRSQFFPCNQALSLPDSTHPKFGVGTPFSKPYNRDW
jgi:hypothetical protein